MAILPSLVSSQQVGIEGVQRLAQLEHHVVGDVDHVVQRPPARGDDPLGEPLGRRPDLDAADEPRGVACAQLGIVDLDGDLIACGAPDSAGVDAGTDALVRRTAPVSRATPATDRQSGRFGVISSSKMRSDRPRYSANGHPTGASSGRMSSPLWSAPRPSSAAEQFMPRDSTPRSFAFLMVMPLGRVAPTTATGTLSPASKFCAPHTIWSGSSSPDVDGGDPERVRVGMTLLGQDLPDDDALERLAGGVDRLDRGAGHVESVGEFLGGEWRSPPVPSTT